MLCHIAYNASASWQITDRRCMSGTSLCLTPMSLIKLFSISIRNRMQALTTELSAFTGVVLKELRGCLSGGFRRCFHRHNLKKIWATCIERLCCFARKHFSDAEMSLKIFHEHGIEERVACPLRASSEYRESHSVPQRLAILPCVNCLLIG